MLSTAQFEFAVCPGLARSKILQPGTSTAQAHAGGKYKGCVVAGKCLGNDVADLLHYTSSAHEQQRVSDGKSVQAMPRTLRSDSSQNAAGHMLLATV